MKLKIGKTRIVFLMKNIAIKIAKPRALRFVFRILFLPFTSKNSRENYYSSYSKNFFVSFRKYVFLGFDSNLLEYNYSVKYNDKDTMPVYSKYFFGWLIVQKRGKEIGLKESFVCPFLHLGFELSPETIEAHQYCYDEDLKKNLLIDYGHIDTIKDLMKTKHLR